MVEHRRYIAVETVISSAINAAISALMAWLVFGGRSEIPLAGAGGVLIDFVPQTFMISLMSVLVPTLLTRNRVRAGRVATATLVSFRLPGNVLLRALLIAIVATLSMGGSAALLMNGTHAATIDFSPLLSLKVAYGIAVALVVTPIAVTHALADERPE